ncbi:PDR/VanB family oxidoreductase [Streptomyces sp. NPDC005917]|uniref:PDR/VanB family oxidoreductase n=1 Tax=unclassified Streptomyces TaxID=2593676 RepID=UPI0033C069C0
MTETDWYQAVVTQVRLEAEQVISLVLAPAAGAALPDWEPGAHIDLRLPSGLIRQYSLCGDPADPHYTVAVLREEAGRGGSAEIHDTALIGRTLAVRGPRNHFALEPAPRYVFLAGGIGITPVLAMARHATRQGAPWSLHYGGRRADTMAFTAELRRLAHQAGAPLTLRSDDAEGPLPLAEIIHDAPEGSLLYACGPAGMLTALRTAVEAGRPELTLRTEQFTATATPTPVPEGNGTAAAFEVRLARTGETVTVEPGTTILDAVRRVRPDVLSSCEEGFCGTCETKVLAGEPVHQDTILSERERAAGNTMMICVGGCASHRLVLDL